MTSEDQDILAKIGQLAGQINRHKNRQESISLPPSHQAGARLQTHPSNYPNQTPGEWRGSHGTYVGRGRGYARGGRAPQVHRNKTLVLNSAASTPLPAESMNSDPPSDPPTATSAAPQTPSVWVTKTDRHLQLINPAIYEKQSQQRAKAIEETRNLKRKQRDERERLKLSKHLQRLKDSIVVSESDTTPNYEIWVQGVRFRVLKNGSKLARISGDENSAKATPKTANVGGVMFYRSKSGNLYRSGVVKAHRGRGIIKKINEPCRAFSTTGSCPKGPKCRYMHDPSTVAICKEFLHKGRCPAGEDCDLSHDLKPERTPACMHFARGNCSNLNCRYTHVKVSPTAPVCRPFGIYGYCEKGLNCTDRHVHECPDFSNTGICNTKGCKLLHRSKASIIRKNNARGEKQGDDRSSDLSSDEDQDQVNSDDVDSDDLDEEYFGPEEGGNDPSIPNQEDFVHL